MRLLVVDDSRTARLILKKVLPPELLTDLTEASGGAEAIARCTAESFDLMFLDLTMPEIDGYQVLERLGSAGRLPRTIVLSADSQPGAQKRVIELGAAAFVKKITTREELEAVLRVLPAAVAG
ncbi:MAG TPA: response regulator [Polyangia bacterium]|nr:response regulator [Polyangia bacterium]